MDTSLFSGSETVSQINNLHMIIHYFSLFIIFQVTVSERKEVSNAFQGIFNYLGDNNVDAVRKHIDLKQDDQDDVLDDSMIIIFNN